MRPIHSFCVACIGLIVAGCSSGEGPKLAPAGGTVSYQGRPLADAVVMFAPETGPLATGTTDLEGRFTLSTGSRRGAVVGPAQVAINVASPQDDAEMEAPSPATTAEEAQAYLEKAGQMQQALIDRGGQPEPRSVIPVKYCKPDTSGLSFTVEPRGRNQFDIKLE